MITRLIPINDLQKQEINWARGEVWSIYAGLKRMGNNQHELFRVQERPEISLNNNQSERNIWDYVKKRKINGNTHRETGRQCRDIFASLKKSCRKLGISFWSYLLDRTSNAKQIYSMADILQAAASE